MQEFLGNSIHRPRGDQAHIHGWSALSGTVERGFTAHLARVMQIRTNTGSPTFLSPEESTADGHLESVL